MSGPQVALSPKAASSLAMSLNELATNAVKHGALSNASGRVDLGWAIAEGAQGPELRLDWRETGGRPPDEPRRTGFGERLLTRGPAARTRRRGPSFDYRPEGVAFTLRAPLSALEPRPADPGPGA
ncbi:MAG: sensor histidine kinase [Caulobacteraceae bacterium]